MNDICLNCGKEYNPELWGAKCDCENPKVVHQSKCEGCDNIIGYIIDDDFCSFRNLYCHECVNKMRL